MQLHNLVEAQAGFEPTQPRETVDKYFAAMKAARQAEHQYILSCQAMERFKPHALTNWHANWKTPVSHQEKFGDMYWALPANTPNGDALWKTIEHYGKRVRHAFKAQGRFHRLADKLKKVYRAETFNDLKYKNPEEKIASTDVPRRIYYSKDSYFNNPYWIRDNVVKRYAGPPGHFPNFTNAERTTLVELERTLRRYDLQGLSKLYGVSLKSGRTEQNRFVVLGADGRFVWKRVGGNVCYVDGKKVSIAVLTDTHDKEMLDMQRQILEPLTKAKS